MAILTFVLASLWLFGVASLVALYVGWRSLQRMKAQPELRGRTVAWAGMAVATFGAVISGLCIGLSFTV